MRKEASVKLVEIEENKRYSILGRAITMMLREADIDFNIDIKAEEDRLKIYLESK